MKFEFEDKTKAQVEQEEQARLEAIKRLEAQIENVQARGEKRIKYIIVDEVEYNLLKETRRFHRLEVEENIPDERGQLKGVKKATYLYHPIVVEAKKTV